MSGTYLFEKVAEMKEKFKKSFIHKKKHKSLENYGEVVEFDEKDNALLYLLKWSMDVGFLEEKESGFLDHFLDKHEVNFLDWSHKTKWLKGKMRAMKQQQAYPKPVQMTMFDYPQMKQYQAPNVPFELLAQMQKGRMERRV